MRRLYIFLILFVGLLGIGTLFSCSSTEKIQIRVVDVDTNQGLEKAQISLNKFTTKGYDWIKFATDSAGFCRFLLPKKEFKYYESLELRAVKRGYYPYIDQQKYHNVVRIDTLKVKNIVLYLSNSKESVTAYYKSLIPDISIKHFVQQLANNEYNSDYLPNLTYNDIPDLLVLGDSKKVINKFPINRYSSLSQQEHYLGTVALWLIESIRLNHGKGQRHPMECYASLNPILSAGRQDYETNEEELLAAFEAYQKWWQAFDKGSSFEELADIDPLETVGLQWR